MLRPGNAGSNTAHDHKQFLADALAQLPGARSWRVGRKVLVRADSGGGTHEFLNYCHRRKVQYPAGFVLTADMVAALDDLGDDDWLAARIASCRAQRTPASGCAVAVHRPRGAATDRLRHQHRRRIPAGTGVAAPPPGPLRGPHSRRERHRRARPPVPQLPHEPDLGQVRRARDGPDRLDANPGPGRSPRTPMGTENTTTTTTEPISTNHEKSRPTVQPRCGFTRRRSRFRGPAPTAPPSYSPTPPTPHRQRGRYLDHRSPSARRTCSVPSVSPGAMGRVHPSRFAYSRGHASQCSALPTGENKHNGGEHFGRKSTYGRVHQQRLRRNSWGPRGHR
jgi:hypothetical protein